MNLPKLKGPEGIRSRMAELQAKLDSLSPRTEEADANFESNLAGTIGSNGAGGAIPVNPFSGGFGINAMDTPAWLKEPIRMAAERYGIDPALLEALVGIESAYNPKARSNAGALGLTQLMPMTANELGVADRTNPMQSLDGGARYLSQMMRRFGGDVQLALAAYNAGPGAVEKASGIPNNNETPAYVQKVLRLYEVKKGP